MEFIWDKKKANTNYGKHSLSFEEAATVFGDPFAITFPDPDHSIGEIRYLTFGLTSIGKYIVVAHTEEIDQIRLISAREMTGKEKKIYEEG